MCEANKKMYYLRRQTFSDGVVNEMEELGDRNDWISFN